MAWPENIWNGCNIRLMCVIVFLIIIFYLKKEKELIPKMLTLFYWNNIPFPRAENSLTLNDQHFLIFYPKIFLIK
jgi:hypothetical protein